MEIVLLKDVEKVGKRGEVKHVAEGFARNFLFPRNLAVMATPGSLRHMERMKKAWLTKEGKEKERALLTAQKLDGASFRITKRAGEKGRLFGSVTNAEIVEKIKAETGIEIDKKCVIVDHIKELGQHEVTIRLAPEVKAHIKVIVLPEEAETA